MYSGAGSAGLGIDDVLTILSRPDDVDLLEIVDLAAQICDSEASGLTVRHGDDYHVPITYGLEPFVGRADDTFCQFTMSTNSVFVVEDAQADSRFANIGWADGRLARMRFYASAPLYSPNGEMVGRLCVIDSDPKSLTALQRRSLEALALSVTKIIELRLLRATRPEPLASPTALAAATVVSQLAAELSHDMKVPLSSIIASVEMLEDELQDHPDRTVAALLARTMRAADRMVRMLEQAMEFGDVGGAPVKRDVDLASLVQQLLVDSATLLEPADAEIVVGELPVVRADPNDMYSVLQNLITNSVKFARPNVSPRVHITSRRYAGGWRVSVSDNGVGIPEDRRVDVFSLFSRLDSNVAGHGIGLATVARIIAAHQGHVGVASVPDGGTEIWFELPDEDGSR